MAKKKAKSASNKGARSSSRKTGKTKSKKRSFIGFVFKWTFVTGLWCAIALAALFAYYATELPNITKDASFDRKRAIIVKDYKGDIVARYGDIVGNKVTIDDIPEHLVQAVLATEDRRFYYHVGVDPLGLLRAVFVNIKEGRRAQGGSTITQQLAKNLFLSQERTYKRKIQEAMLAFWLEYRLTKDEILSAYLNRVYLGSGVYGVDAAAQRYFKTPVKEITLRESATLAGLLKAPSRYSPLSNPALSKARTDTVLAAMADAGFITDKELKAENAATPKPTPKPSDLMADQYYTDWVVDTLDELIGTPNEDLIVETTMNPRIQKYAQDAIADSVSKNAGKNVSQGAMVVMRPNGAVVAIVGGTNYTQSQFNRATQALRPPGSSFKPIVYLTALEKGWHPNSWIIDEPINRKYAPKNFGGKYYGEVTLTEALTLSLNTVSVNLMRDVTPEAVIDSARRMGIKAELDADLSLALGSNGITLLEMANAYSTISNGGLSVEPYAITKITSKDTGELYYERPANNRMKRVFNGDDIQNITSMMHSVMVNGTGRGAQIGIPAAGKTGTSQDSRDALFMGFTRELVGVVWFGNDDNSPMKSVTGGSFPATTWASVMGKSTGMYPSFNNQGYNSVDNFNGFLDRVFSFGGSEMKFDYNRGLNEQVQYNNRTQRGTQRSNAPLPKAERRTIQEAVRYND